MHDVLEEIIQNPQLKLIEDQKNDARRDILGLTKAFNGAEHHHQKIMIDALKVVMLTQMQGLFNEWHTKWDIEYGNRKTKLEKASEGTLLGSIPTDLQNDILKYRGSGK